MQADKQVARNDDVWRWENQLGDTVDPDGILSRVNPEHALETIPGVWRKENAIWIDKVRQQRDLQNSF